MGKCESTLYRVQKQTTLELERRRIHRNHDVRWQTGCLLARSAQHPLPNFDNHARLFCKRNEVPRGNQAKLRMSPSKQRLESNQRSRPNVDLWLIVSLELMKEKRLTKITHQGMTRCDPLFHGCIKTIHCTRSSCFGGAKCDAGVLQQDLRFRVASRGLCDTNTCAAIQNHTIDEIGSLQQIPETLCDQSSFLRRPAWPKQNDELVSVET